MVDSLQLRVAEQVDCFTTLQSLQHLQIMQSQLVLVVLVAIRPHLQMAQRELIQV